MFLRTRALRVVLVAVLGAGCASSSAGAPSSAPRQARNTVSGEELLRAGNVSVYDALVKVRPTFLRTRTSAETGTTVAPIRVYVGGMAMSGLDHLKEVMASAVVEVTYLEPQQAISRFGGNNSSGAIVVVLK